MRRCFTYRCVGTTSARATDSGGRIRVGDALTGQVRRGTRIRGGTKPRVSYKGQTTMD